jgi:hypothetical protein
MSDYETLHGQVFGYDFLQANCTNILNLKRMRGRENILLDLIFKKLMQKIQSLVAINLFIQLLKLVLCLKSIHLTETYNHCNKLNNVLEKL